LAIDGLVSFSSSPLRMVTCLGLAILDRAAIVPPARILDAGCGWGVTLEALESRGYRASGLDISRPVLERLDRPDRRLIEADLTQPSAGLRPACPEFDAILALDGPGPSRWLRGCPEPTEDVSDGPAPGVESVTDSEPRCDAQRGGPVMENDEQL
jgi:hypothetical protein